MTTISVDGLNAVSLTNPKIIIRLIQHSRWKRTLIKYFRNLIRKRYTSVIIMHLFLKYIIINLQNKINNKHTGYVNSYLIDG
jgi:NAD-specific glutamate dehydrogenase